MGGRFTDHAVMAGLVPAIHAFSLHRVSKTWMPGTSPGMTKERVSLALIDEERRCP
jgi:hypothetical protein